MRKILALLLALMFLCVPVYASNQLVGLDIGSYTFSPGTDGQGTITFSGMPSGWTQAQIVKIYDVTTGATLYNLDNPLLHGSLSGNVLKLDCDTSQDSSTDVLQVWVDIANSSSASSVSVTSLPSTPAGTNNIGSVNVSSLPTLPTGTNNIGTVSLNSGTNAIGSVKQLDTTVSGTITTQNLNGTGTATAGSAVALSGLNNSSTLTIEVPANTVSVGMAAQVSLDGTNWTNVYVTNGTGTIYALLPSSTTGTFQANIAGCGYFRVVQNSAFTGSATVILQSSSAVSSVAIGQALPTGSNTIGYVKLQGTNALNSSFLSLQSGAGALPTAIVAPASNTDLASSARTASGNSGTIADDFGQAISSLVNVTAVSGTSPTLDVEEQVSRDNGTTWDPEYDVERFTATGTARVPLSQIDGRRRWLYTIGGTSPSFTFSITTMRSNNSPLIQRRFFDRYFTSTQTINTGSTNVFNIEGLGSVTMVVSAGTCSTAPQFKMQFSDDGSAWFDACSATTTVASGTVISTVSTTGLQGKYVRSYCTTAGVSSTINYISFYGTSK
jgi:hypothetical protein